MKRQLLLFFLLSLVILSGCKKENVSTNNIKVSNLFFDSSIAFLQAALSTDNFERLDLSNFEQLQIHDKVLGFKIFEKDTPHDQFLILGNASGKFEGDWVDMSDLKVIQSVVRYSGSVVLKSLDEKFTTKIVVEKDKVIDILKQGNNGLFPDYVSPMLPEIIVYVELSNNDENGGGGSFASLYWLMGQNYSYSGYYYADIGSSGSNTHTASGTHGDNVYTAATFISPDAPILDLKKEVECFTNNSSANYTISINVNQPFPNSRDVLNVFAVFPVGHTYLTFDQGNADGTHTIRNVGFYPKDQVKAGKPVDKSVFGEDSNTPFDVSLKIEVSGSDFSTVIGTLLNEQSANYDLDNFNCTNAPMSALGSININLPSTKSTDLLFHGNNPADLGEDLRNLDLDKFSKENGNRKMTRSVSNLNSQKPPAKKGTC